MVNLASLHLSAGLYLIATPIGSARDITLRALDLLAHVDVITAEDTRSLRRLMDIHGIPLGGRPLLSYHDHNGHAVRPKLLAHIADGKSVLYASEAGSPLIADPGYDLVRGAIEAGAKITSAPGPSAVITALSVGGLPTDRFFFAGFLPNASGKRATALKELSEVPGTLVFYEAASRITKFLGQAHDILGERDCVLCRELTKKFEEHRRGSLSEMRISCETSPPKGELVVLINRASPKSADDHDIRAELEEALAQYGVRDAVDLVTAKTGAKRREVYKMALAMR